MTRTLLLVSFAALVTASGCQKKRTAAEGIRAAIEGGDLDEARDRCASALATGGDEGVLEACERDFPVAVIARSVEEAEAARKEAPDRVLPACFGGSHPGQRASAIRLITRAGRVDDETRALIDRFNKVCPENVVDLTQRTP